MLNRIYYISLLMLLCSCSKKPFSKREEQKEDTRPLLVYTNHIIDSLSASFPKEYPVNFYTVTHEKKNGKDYIRVSTATFFNKDSISSSYIHNGKVVILYSKRFFTKNIKNNFVPDESFEYKDETISLYHPQYVIFEITGNKYKNISQIKGIKMNLFNYGDRYIPEAEPTHLIK